MADSRNHKWQRMLFIKAIENCYQIYVCEKLTIDLLTLDSREEKFDYPTVWETLVS